MNLADKSTLDEVCRRLDSMQRRGVITTNPDDAAECCGLERDDDGFCVYHPGHPIYFPRIHNALQ